jgi:hypothetical protein
MVERDTGESMPVLPFFSMMDDTTPLPLRAPNGKLRLVYPTGIHPSSKGFDLVLRLAERLQRSDVEIVVRQPGEGVRDCLPALTAQGRPRERLRHAAPFLSGGDYRDLIAGSDVVLVPYRRWAFCSRTSGVVHDAALRGKPMVGTADTWIGDCIGELDGGATFPDGDAGAFTAAVNDVVDRLAEWQSRIAKRREAWLRRNNVDAFVQAIVGIGSRRAPISPARRDLELARLTGVLHAWLPLSNAGSRALRRALGSFRSSRGELRLHRPDVTAASPQFPLIAWSSRGVEAVELRLDAPDGCPVTRGGPEGEAWGSYWIESGRVIFLQDVSQGRPLTAANTLATAKNLLWDPGPSHDQIASFRERLGRYRLARFRQGAFGHAAPQGRLRADWLAPRTVRLSCEFSGTPAGVDIWVMTVERESLFASLGQPGTADTGAWATPEMVFLLRVRAPEGEGAILDVLVAGDTLDPRYPVTGLERWSSQRSEIPIGGLARRVYARDAGDIDDPLARAREMLREKVEETLSPEEWGVLPPPKGSGEMYLVCAYSGAFLEKHGRASLAIFVRRPLADIARLFPHAPLRAVDVGDLVMEEGPYTAVLRERAFFWRYAWPDHPAGITRHTGRRASIAEMFLDAVDLTPASRRIEPRVSEEVEAAASRRFREAGLVQGRTAILAPRAVSQLPIPGPVWLRIARVLSQRGWIVATNVGPNEVPLAGTQPLSVSFSELYAMTEMGGLLLSARSGLCELCCTARTRLHILLDDRAFLVFHGVTVLRKLSENGLPDRAVYHTLGFSESPDRFAERVLDHPDLR